MLSFLKPKHQSILGIDISATSIKILELSKHMENCHIEGYANVTFPDSIIEANHFKDTYAVASALKNAISRHPFTTKKAAIAVSDSAAISKVIQVNEGVSALELEELVVIEAEKFIPFPIDEINIDFNILGPSPKNTAMQEVLIVASRAENVNCRVDLIQQAGLIPTIVDVESFAIERAAQLMRMDLPSGGENKVIAIINVGYIYTHLYVMYGLKVIYSREMEIGEKQLIDAIIQQYQMSSQEALIALDKGSLPESFLKDILNPYQEMLLLQIKRSLQFFFSTSPYNYVDHILIGGGVEKIVQIDSLCQKELHIPVTIANPIKNMTLSDRVDAEKIHAAASSLLIACGLALRNGADYG